MTRLAVQRWAAVAAIAALAAIWFFSRARPPIAPPFGEAAPPAIAGPPADAPAIPAAAVADAPVAAATPAELRRRPSAPASVDWASVPEAARVADLGPALARPVYDALQAAREQMDTCFEEERRRAAHVPAANRANSADSSTILVLRLQSRAGGLDVVGSEVEARGDASEQLVSCARIVLDNWPIPAPEASAGRRYRLKYLLQ